MAAYTQYSDGSNGQTTVSQRLLHNGSDYISVRTGNYQYVILQGELELSGSTVTYTDCQKWVYTTAQSYSSGTPDLDYTESDSGTVTLTVPAYVYSSFPQHQHLDVMNVMDPSAFSVNILIGFILVSCVFQVFRRIRNRMVSE